MNLGPPKVERLTEANNLEASAIRRQIASLAACYGVSAEKPVVSDTAAPVQNEPEVAVNLPATDSVTVAKAPETIVPEPIVPEPPATVPVVTEPAVPEPAVPEPEPLQEETPPAATVARTVPAPVADRLVFRVQLAASKAPLSFGDLSRVSGAGYPVEVVSEGEWLKYQTIGVPLYGDAQRVLQEIHAQGPFIVAYRNGIKQNLPAMITLSRELEKKIQSEGRAGLVQDFEYHLEIAASGTPLPKAEISKIYSGPDPVLTIMDRGLYKYHLFAGYTLKDADLKKQQTGLSRAGIVAYRSGRTAE